MQITLNTDPSGAFHCPLHHYYMTTYNETLHGFKARCDAAACVLEVYEI